MPCAQTVKQLAGGYTPIGTEKFMACLEEGVIGVCVFLGDEQPEYDLQVSPVQRGSDPSVVVSIDTIHRVQSPLERWLSMVSMLRWSPGPVNSFFNMILLICGNLKR